MNLAPLQIHNESIDYSNENYNASNRGSQTGNGGIFRLSDRKSVLSPRGPISSDNTPRILSHKIPLNRDKNRESITNRDRRKRVSYFRKNALQTTFYDDENLGENFDETPWLPPSLEKAKEYRQERVFRGGTAPLSQTKVVNAADLGIGTSMYFQLVRSITICLFFMSLLSIPAMLFSSGGTNISQQDQDFSGLYKYTIGNLGYDTTSSTYASDSACQSSSLISSNATCIHFLGQEITIDQASYIICAMELGQVFCFLITWLYLDYCLKALQRKNEVLECSIADYSVIVKNLPPDTNLLSLVQHFSNLYPLDKPDWLNRPGILSYHPVDNIVTTGNPIYRGTWIAECILHKKIGKFLAAFKNKESLTNKLYRNRALMKMYSDSTPHKYGPNKIKYDQAEIKMKKALENIEQITKKQLKTNGFKFKSHDVAEIENGIKTPNAIQSGRLSIDKRISIEDPQYYIDTEVVNAFICFEYIESMARCVEDYEKYSTFPWSLVYPEQLKYRGRKLRVHQAPDPEEITWENLEISRNTKRFYRSINILLAFILSVIAFLFIIQPTIYKNRLSSKIPSDLYCNTIIPSLYRNTSTTITLGSMKLVRPDDSSIQSALDDQCSVYISSSFYAVYSATDDYTDPVVPYSLSSCNTSSTTTTCPEYGQSEPYCPCISTKSNTICQSKECTTNGLTSSSCETFEESFIGYCYCKTTLIDILINTKSIQVFKDLQDQQSSSTCGTFFTNYSLANGLSYVSIIATLIINRCLLYLLTYLTVSESYNSLGKFQASLMLKTFFLTYINLALLVIIASGKSPNTPSFFKTIHIFDGTYEDFIPGWYGNIGTYFITSLILNAISPILNDCFIYFIYVPIKKMIIYPSVREKSSQTIVQQKELNDIEVGPVFNTTECIAQVLSILFFMMTFGAGLPMMMPITWICFWLYFNINKLMICRYNQRPPHASEYSIILAINLLPYAAIIRLGIACWMYGNEIIFPNTTDTINSHYANAINTARQRWQEYAPKLYFLGRRVCKTNVFPLFCLLVVIFITRIGYFIWLNFKIVWITDMISYCCCNRDRNKLKNMKSNELIHPYSLHDKRDRLRKGTAPYTAEFYQYIRNKNAIPSSCLGILTEDMSVELTEEEIDSGWVLIELDGYVMKMLPKEVNSSSFNIDNNTNQVAYNQASIDLDLRENRLEFKHTYEFVAEHGCNTYSLSHIPAYKPAITTLTESVISVLDDENNNNDNLPNHSVSPEQVVSPRRLNPKKIDVQYTKIDVNDEIAKLRERLKPKPLSLPK